MHRALIALLVTSLLGAPAWAAPVVVWFTAESPAERDMRRAEALLDGQTSLHLSGVDLAWAPAPWTQDDAKAFEALRAAAIDGRARWDQFDVELDIAEQLGERLAPITVVRDRRDLEQVANALLLQGAAIERAFPPLGFQELDEAEPFRVTVPGAKVNRAWVWAMAIQPDRVFNRGDLADGGPWPAFSELQQRMQELPSGYLDISGVPRGATLFVDGDEVEMGLKELDLRPGFHFVHVVRDGVVGGRQLVEVQAGLTAKLEPVADRAQVEAASAVLLGGSTVGFPADVADSLDALTRYHGGEIYVAAAQDGKLVVQPYGGKAAKVKKRPVTVVVNGELGGGVVVSSLFDGSNGEQVTSPAAMGGLGLEIGIFNGVLLGGFDLAFTPGKTITHGNRDLTENITTSVLPQAWGGVGVYVLRPNEARTTLMLAGTYGWYGPAHNALGGRVVLGIPIDQRGTWFRLTVGGVSAGSSRWDTGTDATPFHSLFMRFGFGARF